MHLLRLLLLTILLLQASSQHNPGFTLEGFHPRSPRLLLDGDATITKEGCLRLTTPQKHVIGHAFYDAPFALRNSTTHSPLSFSANFVFAVHSKYHNIGGNGIAFALASTTNYTNATGSQYLGLLNSSDNGNAMNHLLFVELDSILNHDVLDINDNHVGINVNNMASSNSTTASYYNGSEFLNLTLISGEPMQLWVDYDSTSLELQVTLSPINVSKPQRPLLSSFINLSGIITDQVYVGFSSSTGSFPTSHYILGWSFRVNGEARPLNITALPKLPENTGNSHVARNIWISAASVLLLFVAVGLIAFVVARRIKFSELVEDWEDEYGKQRFSYKELHRATNGFCEKRLLGVGGFGTVYRGVLPSSKTAVAVKKVSRESKEGTKEFIAELVSLSNLRHRNIVQLYGYCRREKELMLVYEYIPNGSLDKLLFPTITAPMPSLSWSQRVRIIKGVAFALCYLHEEWEKVVIHRDVKASNVLVDACMSGKLGDFGLARLYDHGNDPCTTHVVGTVGYLAPELLRTGRATKATDMYAFGALVLEVVTGRRATGEEEESLVDWVRERWRMGGLSEVVDGRMGGGWEEEEVGKVVGLGLGCCDPVESMRPEIKQVVGELAGDREVKLEMARESSSLLQTEAEPLETSRYEDSSFITTSVLWTGR